EEITGLANRTHHVDTLGRSGAGLHRLDVVISGVVTGPQQIVHARVGDHEAFATAVLYVQHAGDENAGLPHDEAAWLDDEPEAGGAYARQDGLGELRRRDPLAAGVGDPQPSPQIQVLDLM